MCTAISDIYLHKKTFKSRFAVVQDLLCAFPFLHERKCVKFTRMIDLFIQGLGYRPPNQNCFSINKSGKSLAHLIRI